MTQREIQNENIGYEQLQSDFYDQQLRSLNPIRTWLHANRYLMIDMLVKARYSKGKKIVDLGCGDCSWNVNLLPVHGVDINDNMLQFAHKLGRLESYEANDFHHTSMPRGDADIIVASEVIEHLDSPGHLLTEVKRVLRPSGKFIVSVPCDTISSLFRPLFLIQCFIHGYIFNDPYYRKQCGHVQHFSPASLRNTLTASGFRIDTIFHMRRFLIFAVAYLENEAQLEHNYDDLTIIMPAFNVVLNISAIISALFKKYARVNIIVCNNGSAESAKKIMADYSDKNLFFLDSSKEDLYGVTACILDGINSVKTPYCVVLESDLEYPLNKISEIYNILKLDYNIVIATRVSVKNWHMSRRILSMMATLLGKIVLLLRGKKNLTYDILSGFWGANAYFIKKIIEKNKNKFPMKGRKVLFDILKVFPSRGLIGEVYYEFEVMSGELKIKLNEVLAYLKALLF